MAASRSRGKKKAERPTLTASMPIVVFHGKESFLIASYTQELRDALIEVHGEIQEFEFDGNTVEAADVLDELRSYSLMQQHKLVIVTNADEFLSASRGADEDDSARGGSPVRKLLESYAENPVDNATLLLRADTWRKGNLDKAIEARGGVIAKCEHLNEAQAATWCQLRCERRYESKLDIAAAGLLVDRVGVELNRLDMEVMKLATAAGAGNTITRELVQSMVGMSKEDLAWSIQEAVASGNPARALTKLEELLTVSRVAVEPLSWSLIELARKLSVASEMLASGAGRQEISKSLRLWGPSGDTILRVAQRLNPDTLAQLLQAAVASDRANKQGLGSRERNLETLTMRVADTIGSGLR